MRMPLHDDLKAQEMITDVGGDAEGPEEAITVDEYLMPLRWTEEEKKNDEVLCIATWYCLNKHVRVISDFKIICIFWQSIV